MWFPAFIMYIQVWLGISKQHTTTNNIKHGASDVGRGVWLYAISLSGNKYVRRFFVKILKIQLIILQSEWLVLQSLSQSRDYFTSC